MFGANLPVLRKAETVSLSEKSQFWPEKIAAVSTDNLKIVYTEPYVSPNDIYRGLWSKTKMNCYSDEDPMRLYWVFTDGEANFSIEIASRWGGKKVKPIKTATDSLLNDCKGTISCDVSAACRWVMTCEYICGTTFYQRNITLYLTCSTVTYSDHQAVFEQICELLRSKGYHDFNEVFR